MLFAIVAFLAVFAYDIVEMIIAEKIVMADPQHALHTADPNIFLTGLIPFVIALGLSWLFGMWRAGALPKVGAVLWSAVATYVAMFAAIIVLLYTCFLGVFVPNCL